MLRREVFEPVTALVLGRANRLPIGRPGQKPRSKLIALTNHLFGQIIQGRPTRIVGRGGLGPMGSQPLAATNQNALQQVDFLLLWKSLHCVVSLDCSIDAFENLVVGRMELGGIGKFRSVKFSHDPTSNLLMLPTRSSYLFYLFVV